MASPQLVTKLREAGLPWPQPVIVRALIDTGASGSVLDRSMIAQLGLISKGTTSIHTPSTGSAYETREIFDASVILGPDAPRPLVLTVAFIESDLASEGFLALIGWDVLEHCILTCDGPSRR